MQISRGTLGTSCLPVARPQSRTQATMRTFCHHKNVLFQKKIQNKKISCAIMDSGVDVDILNSDPLLFWKSHCSNIFGK